VHDHPEAEFTGERVIPGQVNDDLWAEHVARYAFAARFASGRSVLDVGCGTGYGTSELAGRAANAIGLDTASEAVAYASEHFSGPHFVQGSATALPFPPASFGLVTAFEVIEHLPDWRALLKEACRVLSPAGFFLVSTPNKLYYAESRAEHGPNPYHHHEFEFDEFQAELAAFFPHVNIFLQNRLETFAFYSGGRPRTAEAMIEQAAGTSADANFFIGVCSREPLPELAALLYVPKAANLLRERERHIRLLQEELAQVKAWLEQSIQDRDQLLQKHTGLQEHLDKQNQWTLELEHNWRAAQDRIVQLQNELQQTTAGYEAQIATLAEENRRKTQWALDTEERLTAELQSRTAELAQTVRLLDAAEARVVERTQWAQRLDQQLQEQMALLEMIRQSRWLQMGRAFGLGPRLEERRKEPE
jgi:SAM-dependent methyltransferase